MARRFREAEVSCHPLLQPPIFAPSSNNPEPNLNSIPTSYLLSTLLSSLSSHLSTLETISSAHLKLGESLQSQIIDEFKKSGEKKESSRKRLGGWVDEVEAERERVEGDWEKAMNKVRRG
jgi:hypothetical protein